MGTQSRITATLQTSQESLLTAEIPLNMMRIIKVTLMAAFLGCVQYVSSKPDITAMRNQKTSDIQGQKSDLNKRSLLQRKVRSWSQYGCNNCIDWWMGAGGRYTHDEIVDRV